MFTTFRRLRETQGCAELFSTSVTLATILFSVSTALATEMTQKKETTGSIRFAAAPHFYYLKMTAVPSSFAKGGSLVRSGLGIEAEAEVALGADWAVGAGLRQAYAPSALSRVLYTALEIRAQYALTGTLRSSNRKIFLDEWPVLNFVEDRPRGFRLALAASQLYFNNKKSVVPFSAIGGLFSYEFPLGEALNAAVGVGYDAAASFDTRLHLMRVVAKLIHPF